jgi:hypothetical protein
MPNDIPTRQNEPRFIDLQAAVSQAYDTSAFWLSWETALIAATATVVPTVNTIYPQFQPWGALISVLVAGADVVFFEPLAKHYHELGAKIQEVLDTDLLAIPWNAIRVGEKPEPETIVGLTDKFKKRHAADAKRMSRLRDWYPKAAGEPSIELGRLICQRSSMVWDATVRKRYCWLLVIVIFSLATAGGAYALLMGWTLAQFLLGVAAPLFPAIVKIRRGYLKHRESASASERARQCLASTWKLATDGNSSPDVLLLDSRHLQDELFDRRKNSSRVPNWFYVLNRRELERQMRRGADELVKQAL